MCLKTDSSYNMESKGEAPWQDWSNENLLDREDKHALEGRQGKAR